MKTKTNPSHLPAEALLQPELFASPLDALSNAAYAAEQYAKGLETGRNADAIHIAVNNVWSAAMKDGASLSSSEKIGYHAHTAELLRGFLDSGCPIIVHRVTPDRITHTLLNPANGTWVEISK